MVKIKFLAGWNAYLQSNAQQLAVAAFRRDVSVLKKTVEFVVSMFDAKDYFYALFKAMNDVAVSPFLATHDYCIKVLHCDEQATVETNISPIYHLGLEYPADYKSKNGKELDENAVVGLVAKPIAGTLPPGHTSYYYGVDAGVLFEHSKIVHNKQLTLQLDEIREGLLVSLHCEHQTSSTTIFWSDVGLSGPVSAQGDGQSDTEMFFGDWIRSDSGSEDEPGA